MADNGEKLERKWTNLLDLSNDEIDDWIRTFGNIQASPQNVMNERIRRDQNRLANAQLKLAAELGKATNAILIFTVVIAVCTAVLLGITIWQAFN
jgi:hypothetical protein